jgi:hypothetical protein
VQSGVTRNGEVQIAYEVFGKPEGRPLLLISGLDGQMIGWPDGFCEALVDAGFQVVRCDEDPLIRPAAGRKIAETVPHGRFVLVHQMGHLFSPPLWPELISEIDRQAA